jgi:hypothetical protein
MSRPTRNIPSVLSLGLTTSTISTMLSVTLTFWALPPGGHIGPEVGRPVHPPERGVLTAPKLARAVRPLAAGSSALDDAQRLR